MLHGSWKVKCEMPIQLCFNKGKFRGRNYFLGGRIVTPRKIIVIIINEIGYNIRKIFGYNIFLLFTVNFIYRAHYLPYLLFTIQIVFTVQIVITVITMQIVNYYTNSK